MKIHFILLHIVCFTHFLAGWMTKLEGGAGSIYLTDRDEEGRTYRDICFSSFTRTSFIWPTKLLSDFCYDRLSYQGGIMTLKIGMQTSISHGLSELLVMAAVNCRQAKTDSGKAKSSGWKCFLFNLWKHYTQKDVFLMRLHCFCSLVLSIIVSVCFCTDTQTHRLINAGSLFLL